MFKVIALLIFTGAAGAEAFAASPADFPTIINYDFLNDGNIEVPGRILIPPQATANPTQKFPLIIFLHGSDEAGTNNTSQVIANIDYLVNNAKSMGYYIYAPQSTDLTDNNVWQDFGRLNDVMLIAGQVVRDYNIDPNRGLPDRYFRRGRRRESRDQQFHEHAGRVCADQLGPSPYCGQHRQQADLVLRRAR